MQYIIQVEIAYMDDTNYADYRAKETNSITLFYFIFFSNKKFIFVYVQVGHIKYQNA